MEKKMKVICFICYAALAVYLGWGFGSDIFNILINLDNGKAVSITAPQITISFIGFLGILYPMFLIANNEKLESKYKKEKSKLEEHERTIRDCRTREAQLISEWNKKEKSYLEKAAKMKDEVIKAQNLFVRLDVEDHILQDAKDRS